MELHAKFKKQWKNLGLKSGSKAEKDLVLDLIKTVYDQIQQHGIDLRYKEMRIEFHQMIRESIPTLPQPILEMDPDAAIAGICDLLRVFKIHKWTEKNHRPTRQNLPGELFETLSLGSHTVDTLELRNDRLESLPPQREVIAGDIAALLVLQRPTQKWGQLSAFWSVSLWGLTTMEISQLTQQWTQEQERRLEGLVSRTIEKQAHLLDNLDQYDHEMVFYIQKERDDLVQAWSSWTEKSQLWYFAECGMANLPSEELLENTSEAAIKRLAIEQQREEQQILQNQEAKLIGRSDWIEYLHDHPPSPGLWRQLSLWNENGFDFSNPLTLYNAPVDIVHASAMDSYMGLCTTYLGEMLSDTTDSLQLSQNDMWINPAYLSFQRLLQFLQIQGHYQDGQTLWWSSMKFEPIDIAYQEDQTRLVDQAGLFCAVTNSFSGHWEPFAGPRLIEGRHGPFERGNCPCFAIIIRDYDQLGN